MALTAALLTLGSVGCSSTADPSVPATSAVVGGSGGSVSTSTSEPSNSDGNIPANPGSVSEQRPPSGD